MTLGRAEHPAGPPQAYWLLVATNFMGKMRQEAGFTLNIIISFENVVFVFLSLVRIQKVSSGVERRKVCCLERELRGHSENKADAVLAVLPGGRVALGLQNACAAMKPRHRRVRRWLPAQAAASNFSCWRLRALSLF